MRAGPYAVLLLLAAGCLGAQTPPSLPPPPSFDAIHFETDAGPFTVILYNESAPDTVVLMRTYVAEGYYVGRSFGRIVPGHVIQVTDAAGGATDDARRVPLETHPRYHFSAGAAGIARGEAPDSGGPELFLMDFATSHLDGNYTVWGQVVSGLDVVHAIARGPAFDFRTLPDELAPAKPTDRLALRPATILATSLVRVTPPPGMFPLHVAQNQRAGDFRHSLEWPQLLEPGKTVELTWYIRGYNGTSPPDAASVRIEIDGTPVQVVGDPIVEGIYRFRWTPPDMAPHEARLAADGKVLARLAIDPLAP